MKSTYLQLSQIAGTVTRMSGCSVMQELMAPSEHHTRTQAAATRVLDGKTQPSASHTSAQPVTYRNDVFVGKTTARITKTPDLPAVFYESVWFNTKVKDINEFAERITLRTKIPAVVGTDVMEEMLDRSERLAEISSNMSQTTQRFPSLPSALPGVGPSVDSAGMLARQLATQAQDMSEMRINFAGGTLAGLLDMVSSRYGVSWRYERGQIRFFMHDSRTFFLKAIPGSARASAEVKTSGAQVGAGTGQQTTGVNSELSVWDGALQSVQSMLSGKGKVVASPSTNSITVTDTPTVLERVAQFVDAQNDLMGKQVMINVEIMSVAANRDHNYGLEWNLVYDDLERSFGIKNVLSDSASAAASALNLSFGVISSSSVLSGSTAMVKALSEHGTVSRKHSATLVALNNQPAPLQTGRQFGYVAESSTTITETGTTSSLTPGSVNSGFSMQVLPTIMPDGRVILQFAADVTTLREIRPVTSGEVTIETPDYDSQNFLQRVVMRSGETLVLSGLEVDGETKTNTGVGSPFFPWLGGGMTSGKQREITVVLITPIIVN